MAFALLDPSPTLNNYLLYVAKMESHLLNFVN